MRRQYRGGWYQTRGRHDEAVTITRREYDEETVVAIDFGPDVEATVDVVDVTAIVVAGDRQLEFDVPPEATEITTNDGILVIRQTRPE